MYVETNPRKFAFCGLQNSDIFSLADLFEATTLFMTYECVIQKPFWRICRSTDCTVRTLGVVALIT